MTISREGFQEAADTIGCEIEAVIAVSKVESSGGGFNVDGTVKTLFEGHWFCKYTNGKYSARFPDLSYPKWTREFYGKTWQAEQSRLNQAMILDKTSAMLSASWGMFQIMGFNFPKCGYKSVQDFVNAMKKSEDNQLLIFTNYIVNSGLADELRDKRWADFARLYNGSGYALNKYDQKLETAYNNAKASA